MDIFLTQNPKHPPNNYNKHNKKRLTQDQVRLLERTFTTNKRLEPELKLHLANQLGVPPRQIAIWYQNKRARWKTQSLELDYNTLQVKLENALTEKRRLERDVKQLQEELGKAQEMLVAAAAMNYNYQKTPIPPLTNVVSSNSCDQEGGSSASLHDQDVMSNHEVLQIDELYACLIGTNNGSSTWV